MRKYIVHGMLGSMFNSVDVYADSFECYDGTLIFYSHSPVVIAHNPNYIANTPANSDVGWNQTPGYYGSNARVAAFAKGSWAFLMEEEENTEND
jgi:hypothetical protein